MPNVITALKAEISRIARKEAKLAVAPLRKPTTGARLVLADLKRRVAALEKDNTRLGALLANAPQQPAAETAEAPSTEKGSISGKEVRSLRQKLGLSQHAFAKLLGIGNVTVYKWEHKPGMLQLRDKTRAALMAALKTGAREVKSKAPQPQAESDTVEAPSKVRSSITGKDLRSLRLSLGLSHQAFAKLLGVGHNTTFRWENKAGILQLHDNVRDALMSAQQMGEQAAKAKTPQLASKTAEAQSSSREGISGKEVRSLRQSLGLSHQEFATLLGVGHNITYKWESKPGMLKLRDNTRAALMSARQMGAREAQAKLAAMKPAKKA